MCHDCGQVGCGHAASERRPASSQRIRGKTERKEPADALWTMLARSFSCSPTGGRAERQRCQTSLPTTSALCFLLLMPCLNTHNAVLATV